MDFRLSQSKRYVCLVFKEVLVLRVCCAIRTVVGLLITVYQVITRLSGYQDKLLTYWVSSLTGYRLLGLQVIRLSVTWLSGYQVNGLSGCWIIGLSCRLSGYQLL